MLQLRPNWRMLRRRPAGRCAGRLHLLVRVHVLRALLSRGAARRLPELRRRTAAATAASGHSCAKHPASRERVTAAGGARAVHGRGAGGASHVAGSIGAAHYLLFYDYVPDVLARRAPLRDAHLRLAWSLACAWRAAARRCVRRPGRWRDAAVPRRVAGGRRGLRRGDPYVLSGLVTRWWIGAGPRWPGTGRARRSIPRRSRLGPAGRQPRVTAMPGALRSHGRSRASPSATSRLGHPNEKRTKRRPWTGSKVDAGRDRDAGGLEQLAAERRAVVVGQKADVPA